MGIVQQNRDWRPSESCGFGDELLRCQQATVENFRGDLNLFISWESKGPTPPKPPMPGIAGLIFRNYLGIMVVSKPCLNKALFHPYFLGGGFEVGSLRFS